MALNDTFLQKQQLMRQVLETNKVLLVVPENTFLPFHRDRIVNFTADYFPGADILEIAVTDPQDIDTWVEQFPGYPVSVFDEKLTDISFGTWVVANVDPAANTVTVPGDKLSWHGKKIYIANWHGSIASAINTEQGWQVFIDAKDVPYADEHIFSRLAPRQNDLAFYFFPYGHFSLNGPAWGKMNSFGHRIDVDLKSLRSRDDNHKVIAVFGGSTVFSASCRETETFCDRLEHRLNEALTEQNSDIKVTVLNFGMSANLVLHQINTYVLFAEQLRPDLVISHAGFNDLFCGMLNEPSLINKYGINYLMGMEDWATHFPGAQDVPLNVPSDPDAPYTVLATPQAVVDTYLDRQFQFKRLAGERSPFVWGLEPLWFGKNLTEDELTLCHIYFGDHGKNQTAFDRIPHAYEMLQEQIASHETGDFINFHQLYSQAPTDLFAFCDPVHQTPDGDDHISEIYFDYIAANFSEEFDGLAALPKGEAI